MTLHDKPFVAITMGDPAGIGAEVTAKALQDDSIYEKCRPFVVGNVAAIDHAIDDRRTGRFGPGDTRLGRCRR